MSCTCQIDGCIKCDVVIKGKTCTRRLSSNNPRYCVGHDADDPHVPDNNTTSNTNNNCACVKVEECFNAIFL